MSRADDGRERIMVTRYPDRAVIAILIPFGENLSEKKVLEEAVKILKREALRV